jgi:hypothetical protein
VEWVKIHASLLTHLLLQSATTIYRHNWAYTELPVPHCCDLHTLNCTVAASKEASQASEPQL